MNQQAQNYQYLKSTEKNNYYRSRTPNIPSNRFTNKEYISRPYSPLNLRKTPQNVYPSSNF